MHHFPILSRNHFDCIPRTAIEKSSIGSFAGAFLTANTEVRIDLDAAKRRMILIGYPEHASFDRTVFDARWRAGASRAAISGNREDARLLLTRGFAVAH